MGVHIPHRDGRGFDAAFAKLLWSVVSVAAYGTKGREFDVALRFQLPSEG